MKAIFTTLFLALFFTFTYLAQATSLEEFDNIPGFPEYQCTYTSGKFALTSTSGENTLVLKLKYHQDKLNKEHTRWRKHLRVLRWQTPAIIQGNANSGRVRRFKLIRAKYYDTPTELNTIKQRIVALAQLKTLLKDRIRSGNKNLRSMTSCDFRNNSNCTLIYSMTGNLDSAAAVLSGGAGSIPVTTSAGSSGAQSSTTHAELADAAAFSIEAELPVSHDISDIVSFYFFKTFTSDTESIWVVRAYVNGRYVDREPTQTSENLPRQIDSIVLSFDNIGNLTTAFPEINATIPMTVKFSHILTSSFYGFETKPQSSAINAIDEDSDCYWWNEIY